MLEIKIHRGTNQIGGTITEIYTEHTHIFIDFGAELSVDPKESTDRNMIEMIQRSRCDAVLFSHYHGDHIGLMGEIPDKDIMGKPIKLGIGKVARKILTNIQANLAKDQRKDTSEHRKMLALLSDGNRWIDFENKRSFSIGDMDITTVRVDHSAYDAYMFIITAHGKTIVHTGDYRTHGRLGGKLFPDLKECLGEKSVNILLTEGTMMDRPDKKCLTEQELENKAYELLNKPENKWAFLVCSSTNVESLASFHNAAMGLGRPFIVNHYVYEQIKEYRKSAGNEDNNLKFWKTFPYEKIDIPNPRLGGKTQPEYLKEMGFVMLVGKSDSYNDRMELFRDCDPLLIYSMWNGYIEDEKKPYFDSELSCLVSGWRSEKLHTSGHATEKDIKEMIKTVNPIDGVIPIHTTRKKDFEKLGISHINVIVLNDGDEYNVCN